MLDYLSRYKRMIFWVIAVILITAFMVRFGLATDAKISAEASQYAEQLWLYRTGYVGDNSSVVNIISALSFPDGVEYSGIELFTDEAPYAVTVHLTTDTKTRNYYTGALHEAPFQVNACIMFSLIENVEYITFSLADGEYEPYSMQYTADWAESVVGADLWEESKTLKKFSQLLIRINDHVGSAFEQAKNETPAQQGGMTFFVKPDEPAQVIGETAAIVWLNSYMGDGALSVDRISDYKINEVQVISGEPKEGQTWLDMKYHYVVRINYNITTAFPEYFAPGDGISGQGTFEGITRELLVKSLGGGNYDILEAGTGGGEQEFAPA
jgi:hypothetical protein